VDEYGELEEEELKADEKNLPALPASSSSSSSASLSLLSQEQQDELARMLTETRRSARWRAWGYDSFEAYATGELHLRKETVEKLTGSFQFLQRRAPEVLERDGLNESIPSYHSVDYLRRAEESESAPVETLREIRKKVIEDCAPVPAIARKYNETVFPIDLAEKKRRDAAGIKNVASRLRELLNETRAVPKALANETAEALDALLAALASDEEAA
jgi:hypothetical protein